MNTYLSYIFAFLWLPSTFAQTTPSKIQRDQLTNIATQDVPNHAPGIATAIIRNGKVLFEKYAGLADLSDSTPIQKETRFNIASTGKQFTALAILKLVHEKKLQLSDDLRKWFPTLYPTIPEHITVQQLLNHTSGIRDVYDLWSLQGYTWWEETFDNSDVLKLIGQQSDLNFPPGSAYLYSNTNYLLLALIVEKVSKQSFTKYTDQLFRQLNMPNTSFESDHTKIRGQIARPYFNFGTWTTYNWIWNAVGDGGIFSTLEDQIQWEKIVQGKAKTSLKKKIIAQSQQLENPSAGKYGYGLEFGTYKNRPYTYHEGATGAWKATVLRFPDQKTSLLTLTNSGKTIPALQTRQMADVLFNLEPDTNFLVTQPTTIGDSISETQITGTYLNATNTAFTFEHQEDKLFLKRSGRNDVELEREAANIFHQKYDPDFKQEFTRTAEGQLQITAYYTNHAPYTLTKTKPVSQDFAFSKLAGTYHNSETKTSISIRHLKGPKYEITFREEDKRQGLLVSESKLLVDGYTFELREGDLYLNGGRIRQVRYQRQD